MPFEQSPSLRPYRGGCTLSSRTVTKSILFRHLLTHVVLKSNIEFSHLLSSLGTQPGEFRFFPFILLVFQHLTEKMFHCSYIKINSTSSIYVLSVVSGTQDNFLDART